MTRLSFRIPIFLFPVDDEILKDDINRVIKLCLKIAQRLIRFFFSVRKNRRRLKWNFCVLIVINDLS